MVAFTVKALLLPLLGAASISALPLPSRAELVRRIDLDLEPKVTVGFSTDANGESDSYSIIVAPVVSPEVLDNAKVSNVLNDLFVALAGTGTNVVSKNSDSTDSVKRDNTAIVASPVISPDVLNNVEVSNSLNDLFAALALTGTNVKHENSNNVGKRDALSDTLSQLLKGDNTAIIASPVVAGDVANDVSLTDSLNDLNLGGALTGTNVNHDNSNNVGKRENTAVVVSPVVSPEVANDLSISDVLNDGFIGLAGTGTNVEHEGSNNVAKRDLINDITGVLGGSDSDNTAIVASPVVAPDVANDLSVSDVLNDGFLGLAGTGTNVKKVNSDNESTRVKRSRKVLNF